MANSTITLRKVSTFVRLFLIRFSAHAGLGFLKTVPRRMTGGSPIIRRLTSLALVILMILTTIPAVVAHSIMQQTINSSIELATKARNNLYRWRKSGDEVREMRNRQEGGMPPRPMTPPAVTPPPTEPKSRREARVSALRINTNGNVLLQSRQTMSFSAVPLDVEGAPINGVQTEWRSSDRRVIHISRQGQAIAGRAGEAILTARAGGARTTVHVTVTEGDLDQTGGRKKQTSGRTEGDRGNNSSPTGISHRVRVNVKREHSSRFPSNVENEPRNLGAYVRRPNEPNEDPLPDDQTNSLYLPSNAVGSPPGKTTPGAQMRSVAVDGTETPGSQNFTFGIAVDTPPGRGLDLSLTLVHNSQLFNRSVNALTGNVRMTYDVDSGWPGPGFRLGYGQIENQGPSGFTLIDKDGTRHALVMISSGNYDTNDGTFVHYTGGAGSGTAYHSDGTQVIYGAGGGGDRIYPTKITDNNGNFILINYQGGVGPKISSIQDTLQRYLNFYYAANGDLVTISAPGMTGQAERAVMRLYYTDITIAQTGLFQPQIFVSAPSSVHTLKYIYLPNSVEINDAHVGYRFDYSSYGMMYQVTQFRGISATWNGPSDPGQYPNEGFNTVAAVTNYNYEGSPLRSVPAGGLADAPDYTQRSDNWAGRSSAQPVYQFSVDKTSGVSTVTAPDGTISETHVIANPGQWDDGLLSDVYIDKQGATFLAHKKMIWEATPSGNPRLAQVRTTDDAGQTKATLFTYSAYNNVSVVSERDFTSDANALGTELRRTETTYQTSSSYLDRHILHLPLTVKVFPGQSATPAARVDYGYDNYGTSHANLTPRDDIEMHDPAFDPFQQTNQTDCHWVCTDYEPKHGCVTWEWVCTDYNPYQPATDYRGNLTSVTTYSNAATGTGAMTHATTYDIAGNIITTEVDCCKLKTFGYSSTFDYAYQTSVTRGLSTSPNLTQGATYDLNTGLVGSTTNENGQVTVNYYNADSLRLSHTDYPDGGATYLYYNDGLWLDSAGRAHFYVNTSTRVDATNWSDVYRFYDARGQLTQSFYDGTGSGPWNSQVIEYDIMGRAYRYTNPFATGGYGGALHLDGPLTTLSFDHLDRITQVTSPSGDDVAPTVTNANHSYTGTFTTTVDQALKQRRQKTDALGRLVRQDEPNLAGDLGSTTNPTQPTNYEYDTLDNLIHVAQPGPNNTQHRYFKYDSLSRLTHERQVEQAAPWSTSDAVAGNNQWSRRLLYNSQSLVQDVYDARRINTHFTYDGLNRLKKMEYFLENGSTQQGTPAVNYTYDQPRNNYFNLGQLTEQSTEAVGSVPATIEHFDYDSMGRVKNHRQSIGSTNYLMSYAYNLGGLLTSETYPSNRVIAYTYGYGGRLSSVSDGSTTFANAFSFAPSGGLNSETWGNGAVHSIGYNRALQPSEIKLRNSLNAELQRYNYTYGKFNTSTLGFETTKNNGQVGRIDGFIDGMKQWEQRFVYDSLGRLSDTVEYRGDNGKQTYKGHYDYDRFGNRFQYQNNVSLDYIAVQPGDIDPATNRLISSGSTPVIYDNGEPGAGNITNDSKFRGLSYAYDANNRNTNVASYEVIQSSVYNSAGQRVQISTNGVTRTMVYDIFGQNVSDYGGTTGATIERENIYRGGQLLATQELSEGAGPINYVLQDLQGSTRAVMDNSGDDSSIIARHDYLPFGEEISLGTGARNLGQGYGASDPNRQRYGLTDRDDVTGLDHAWWRKYENRSGRWTTPDPYNGSMNLGDPQSFNRYSYVGNDSPNRIDPSGLDTKPKPKPGDSCRTSEGEPGIIGQDGKCYKGPSEVVVVYDLQSLFPDLFSTDNWKVIFRVGSGPDPTLNNPFLKGADSIKKVLSIKITDAQRKQSAYEACFKREMAPTGTKFENMMRQNLVTYLAGFAIGGARSGNLRGAQVSTVVTLASWKFAIENFGRDELVPAQNKAKKTCEKEAGL